MAQNKTLLPRSSSPETAAPSGKLGTFAGVFTPSILTILGIILFLRLGYVVGNAGLWRAFLVIAVANSISVLTSFSLAAIATNFRVRGGGDYYLISRSLGPEFGGAIGLVLFLAQSVSVAFYAIGFAEGVNALLAIPGLDPRLVAGMALLPLFALSWLGSDWATKFQFAIMAVLALAIGAFVIGALGAFDKATLAASHAPAGDLSFWVIFALFFPAVTGFTQGVSMSGDLRDPAKSLPLGTFLAVGISVVVYVGITILLAGSVPGADLVGDYDAMRRVAAVPWLISGGLFAATLSSALSSFLGAPRILQALAADKLFGFLTPFAKVTAKTGNPRRAVLLAFAIAIVTVIFGNLNLVAPIVSMFFLISYGLMNYATYYEASAASPAFRPRFRGYHPWLSLAGGLACGGAMFAIDPTAGAVAAAVLMGIHQYVKRSGHPARWADGSRSALFQDIRRALLAMSDTVEHDRDWRPVILVVSDDPARRERIIRFAAWIEGGSGLTTAVRLHQGEGMRARAEGTAIEEEMRVQIRESGLHAFPRVIVSPDRLAGFRALVQGAGIGPIQPNLALFNGADQERASADAPAMHSHGELMRSALRYGCHLVVFSASVSWFEELARLSEQSSGRADLTIDVWWRDDASSRLSLLLAYLMTRQDPWMDAKIRVLAPLEEASEDVRLDDLKVMLDEVRISAEAIVVADTSLEAVRRESDARSLAFLPARLRDTALCDPDGEPILAVPEGGPASAFVQAVKDIVLDSQPDEGPQAEAAKEQDALQMVQERAEQLRAEVETHRADAKGLAEQIEAGRTSGASQDELSTLEELLAEANRAADEVERRAAKAEAQVVLMDPEAKAETSPTCEGRQP